MQAPDLPNLGPEELGHGLGRTLIGLGVYLALLVGAIIYILLKLPRSDEAPPSEGPSEEQQDP